VPVATGERLDAQALPKCATSLSISGKEVLAILRPEQFKVSDIAYGILGSCANQNAFIHKTYVMCLRYFGQGLFSDENTMVATNRI